MPLVRRSASSVPARGEPGGVVHDDVAVKRYPTLCEFLATTVWPDGAPRTTGSISLFFEDSLFKACLNDRDASLSAFVSSPTLAGVLDKLEAGLVADKLDWRAWKGKGVAKKR